MWTGIATTLTWIGLAGVVLYIAAYAALQLGLLRARGYAYPFLNLLAASCVLVGLLESFNISSALIQILWIGISLVGMARLYWLSRSAKFDAHEQILKDSKFAGVDPAHVRQVLNAGQWLDGETGDVLTIEGMPVKALFFLLDARARVTFEGREVADCAPGSLVGEAGVLNGSAATATVTLSEPGRYFSIDAEKLRALVHRNAELAYLLHQIFSADLRGKLMTNNRERAARSSDE